MKTTIVSSTKKMALGSMLAAAGLLMTSCQTHTQQGALYGGLGGAAIGAIADGGRGALIGGALGAAGGAAIGSGKDRRYGYRY